VLRICVSGSALAVLQAPASMRLLKAASFQIMGFLDERVAPPYAILSHQWATDEVSYHDIQNLERVRQKGRFRKIEFACKQALVDGLDHVWSKFYD
jgi:hypothetical protein